MIHIATVHYKTDKWIDIQLRYLKDNIKQPFRVYTFLCGNALKHKDKYFYSCTESITDHATKLNILADIIYFAAEDKRDPLIFIDGDAFPISPLDDFIERTLNEYPLAAIQRLENIGDKQPHPSFCITRVGFWKSINGDWKSGYTWKSSMNTPRSDVGGNLLKVLEDNGYNWMKLHRSNSNPFHPVLFGVYNNLIYHHGAGYRDPLTMHDRTKSLKGLFNNSLPSQIFDTLLRFLSLKNRYRIHRWLGIKRRLIERNLQISDKIYSLIHSNDSRFFDLIKGDTPEF